MWIYAILGVIQGIFEWIPISSEGVSALMSQFFIREISPVQKGLAVIPGLSRSGSTIFGLSLGKFSLTQILKISYMMSAPVVLASGAYLFLENPTLIWLAWPSLVSSFFVGFFTLHFLIKLSTKINFFKFALIFALLCFIGAGIGLIF